MRANPAFARLGILVGDAAMRNLERSRVILFGIGGVGSWCAEALIRSGIGHLTIVDSDRVCTTNINRQLEATTETIGRIKVDELSSRFRTINPDAEIVARHEVYTRNSANDFGFDSYDYVIDAIDTLSCKIELIIRANQSPATFYSALGASARLDPSRIKVGSIWDTMGCRLGRFVRKRLRKRGFAGDYLCIYSDEYNDARGESFPCGSAECEKSEVGSAQSDETDGCSSSGTVNGSAVHMTGIFGFQLAGLVIGDIVKRVGTDTAQG